MPAAVKPLGLYDLLAPQFLAGFQFPDYIDKYLSVLAVADVQSTSDANSILYTGRVFFPSSPGSPPVLQHREPGGRVFDIQDLTLQFRLLVPRAGSAPIKNVIESLASIPQLQPIKDVVDSLGAQTNTPTDYPGIAFQLELLLSGLQFHLGDDWKPGKLGSDFFLSIDTAAPSDDVRIVLPKVLMRYQQGQDFTTGTSFKLASWGNPGFDAPNDLSEGELASMDPPLAVKRSLRWGLAVDEIVVDLSDNNTPPEILDHFGEDQSFEGLYIKLLQIYYADADKDTALNFAIRDALVSFHGDFSFEAELDIIKDTPFSVDVRIYDGKNKLSFSPGSDDNHTGVFTGGKATIPPSAVIYLQVTAGIPPFTYSVAFTPDAGGEQQLWSDVQRQAKFASPPASSQHGSLVIQVTDSAATPHTYKNTLDLTVAVAGAPSADTPPDTAMAQAHWNPDPPAPPPAGVQDDAIVFTPSPQGSGISEVLKIQGGPALPSVKVANAPYTLGADRQVLVDVKPGDTIPVEVDYPGSDPNPEFDVLFQFDEPHSDALESTYVDPSSTPSADPVFAGNRVPTDVAGGEGFAGAAALRYWVQNALDLSQPINITGFASNEGQDGNDQRNLVLSQRRADIAFQIVSSVAGANVASHNGQGTAATPGSRPEDRVAKIVGTAKSVAAYKLTGTLTRDAAKQPTTPPAPEAPPAPPGPPANKKPGFLRRLSLRTRFEHNDPVLAEVSGEVDFETGSEAALRNTTGSTDSLGLQPTTVATTDPNPGDGLTDFSLTITHDKATDDYLEDLKLGAAPADIDGLLRMTNAQPFSRLKDTLGAVLIFTPILNAATEALDPSSAGDWSAIGVDLGVPAAIGALGFLHATDATLFGGELVLRENIPSGISSTHFTNAALTFDYGVSFRIDVDALDIHSSRSMKVRYKAVGLNLHFGDPAKFEFVLDTSKGYSLDLSDPSLFDLPAPLGNLLKVGAARIARFNPLTLELDLEIKADLGIITVDKFQVKIPLDGASPPMILPSGIKVNIPSAIVGSGSVKIDSGGFQGTIDVTLVALKLRMAASVGVEHISQPPREATAFFLGLELDFPAPIILGSSGLGLFGLFGLFGLNYARVLDITAPTDPVGPDLRWLMKTGGAPYKLDNNGVALWTPTLDTWEFGVGVLLGTVDGFLLNLRGMFILELPGPRILITVNLHIIADLPGVSPDGMDTSNLDVGIVGILDIDVGAGTITLGVMIGLDIESLVTIQIPIQIFFDENNTSNWHVWIGTIQSPASAKVLGIVRGTGYFMAGGQAISPFPPGSSGSLPGVAVATGVAAPIIWGSEDIDIYLKVVISADLGVSFTPHLFIVGTIHVEGELRLVIVSVGASGDFTVTAPDPFFLKVHICGKVSFFFFDVSACVDFQTAPSAPAPPPPPPLISKMYLQSFAPVIASGQGGERPIDASLGDAVNTVASGLPGLAPPGNPGPIPVVPVDSVPVVQMLYGADASTVTQTFTVPITACPTYPGGAGVSLGGGRKAHYKLRSVLLDPSLPSGELPPAVWRPNKPSSDTSQTQVDLALFSRNPNVTNSALERSTDLSDLLLSIWGDACGTIAPPACVFWAFCGQRLGPSPDGWTLFGTPAPDPPNTQRSAPVPIDMQVEQPSFDGPDKVLMDLSLQLIDEGLQPAQVVGPGSIQPQATPRAAAGRSCFRAVELPELLTAAFTTKLATELDPELGPQVLSKLKAQVASSRWLRFHIGASSRVRMLIGIDPNLFKTSQGTAKTWFLIRERDASGNVTAETPLVSMNPILIAAVSNLPTTWIAPGGPWGLAATQVFSLLSSLHLAVILVEFKPRPTTTTIEVTVTAPMSRVPTLLVGAIESCPSSENDRYQNGLQIQESTVQTLEGYLDGGSAVPLLQKDTLYTATLNYDVTVTEQDGSNTDFNNITQAWQFRTDKRPPTRLDAWVLCTSPAMNEQHAFYEDPVDVIFNDNSIIQLFSEYGFQLQLDLRAADGLPEPSGAPVTTVAINGVGTASYDALQQLVAEGKLPCVGSTVAYQNQMFTAPVTLRPLMGYTLDIVTNPSSTPAADPSTPVTPLFRRTFATSKYPSMRSLAADLGATRVEHRGLKSSLSFSTPGGKDVRPDQDIQDLFTAAGEQALPAADKNRIVIYWAPSAPNGPSVPEAILIDCTEPLWRTRSEPTFQTPIPTDPSFKIVAIGPATALEVVEQGGPNISAYLVSPGGTRTVAFFKPGFAPAPGGTGVTLALHRPASTTYGNAAETDVIVTLRITPNAIWDNDHA